VVEIVALQIGPEKRWFSWSNHQIVGGTSTNRSSKIWSQNYWKVARADTVGLASKENLSNLSNRERPEKLQVTPGQRLRLIWFLARISLKPTRVQNGAVLHPFFTPFVN
jgi:hypothetical protein